MLRLRGLAFGEGEADETVFASEVKFGLRENRSGPARIAEGRNLPASEFLAAFRGGAKEAQKSAFAEGDEAPIGINQGSSSENFRLA